MSIPIASPNNLPTFVSNQVLTAQLLNNLRDYLDAQTRLSILRGVGRGIVCGLEATVDTTAAVFTVKISEGYGFTSEGYLIQYGGGTFSFVQKYNDPIYTLLNDGKKRDFEPKDYKYEPWRDTASGQSEDKQLDTLLELKTTQTVGDATSQSLSPITLNSRILVLYLEIAPTNLRSCVSSDCNNKGWEIKLNVKPLLIPKSMAKTLPVLSPNAALQVPRLHNKIPLSSVNSGAQLTNNFHAIAIDAVTKLDTEIENSYNKFKNILDLGSTAPPKALAKIATPIVDLQQYEYDFAKDLTAAYNEFLEAANPFLNMPCFKDLNGDTKEDNDFPRHLVLGAMDFTEGYRHIFEPSAALLVADEDRQYAKNLFKRLTTLIACFNPVMRPTTVKLMPSRSEAYLLGQRALPYYYDVNINAFVKNLWQPKNSFLNEVEPLNFSKDYAQLDLIRIEGHIGQEPYKTIDDINIFKKNNNIEFDVIPIFLNNPLNPKQQFNNFAAKFPGLEHLGGVPKGGSLILVCEAQAVTTGITTARIIADFALAGSIEDCCGCCADDFNLLSEHFTVFYTPPVATAGVTLPISGDLDVLRRFSTTFLIPFTVPSTSVKQQATLQMLTLSPGPSMGVRYMTTFNPLLKPTLEDCFTVSIDSGGIRHKLDVTVLILPRAQAVDNTVQIKVSGLVEEIGNLARNPPFVPNAVIQVGFGRVLTQARGNYSLETRVPIGEHLVTAQHPDGQVLAFKDKLNVIQDNMVFKDVNFSFIKGVIISAITGRILVKGVPIIPSQGNRVEIAIKSPITGAVVTQAVFTVVNGLIYSFSSTIVPPGNYTIAASLFATASPFLAPSSTTVREASVVAGQTFQADLNFTQFSGDLPIG